MPQEKNIEKLEGEVYIVELTLNDADGAVDCSNYDVYGAAETVGQTKKTFEVTATDKPGKYHISIPALSFTRYPYWDYQICARRRSTGHEWLILHGKVSLRYRIADFPSVKVGAPQSTFEATIAPDLLSVNVYEIAGAKGDKGDKGDRGDIGLSAYDIACKNGFQGTEQEWLGTFQKGDKGDPGEPGPQGERGIAGTSAYEYAQQAGFQGTEAEFALMLAELKQYKEIAYQAAIDACNAQIKAEIAAANAINESNQ